MDFKEYQEKAATTAMYDQKLLKRVSGEMGDIFIRYVADDRNGEPLNDKEQMAVDICSKVTEKIVLETLMPLMRLSYVGLGMGEVGEIQNKLKKIIRDKGGQIGQITDEDKKDLKGELGDILWYVAAMCKELGLDMNDVAEGNIDKLFSRKERGVLTGSGDNR